MDVIQDNVMIMLLFTNAVRRVCNLEKSGFTLQMLIFDYIILDSILLKLTKKCIIYYFFFLTVDTF
jgi:hypothetical protein